MTSFDGPTQLSSAILGSWKEIQGFPPSRSIEQTIVQIYRLSLTVNEGRYLRLLFAFWGHEKSIDTILSLDHLVPPLYLADIVSWAPAIAPPPFALVISGAVGRCSGIANLRRVNRSPGLYLGIRGPGELEGTISREESSQSWILNSGVCQKALDIGKSESFKDFCISTAAKTEFSSQKIALILRRVVCMIARKGHGGTLLFSENNLSGLATAPKIDFSPSPISIITNEPRNLGHQADLIETVSGLTQIDGATLLDSELRLKGAGVFVNHEETEVWTAMSRQTGCPVDMHSLGLGSRHRSAAWFCREAGASLVIVISQDRLIRIFTKKEGKVFLEGPFVHLMTTFDVEDES